MPQWSKRPPRLVEVRSLGELAIRLVEWPTALAFVEVHVSNLADVLQSIGNQEECHPGRCVLALLDESLHVAARIHSAKQLPENHDIADALREAGAADVATSPRHLHDILTLAQQYVATKSGPTSYRSEQPLLEWALEQLPWQSTL